ncbi:unnamed protein product [Malus baccata var. baccata]
MHTRRSKSIDLVSYNPKLERTLRKLHRKIKQKRASVSLPPSSPPHLSSEEEEEPQEGMADNRTLRELATPNTDQQPLCITYPYSKGGFKLKSGMIHYLPKFHGFSTEDANKHLMEFHVVCSRMRPANVDEEQVKLRAFLFTLEAKAKAWLYNLPPGSMNTWNQVKQAFLEQNFPATKAASVMMAPKQVCGVRAMMGHATDMCPSLMDQGVLEQANKTDKAIENLEHQMSQLASLMGQQHQLGRLPSQTVVNPNAEQMNIVTLRSGKEIFEQPMMQKRTRKDTNEQGDLQTKNLEQDEASIETEKSPKAT